jgi:hypothetical protein
LCSKVITGGRASAGYLFEKNLHKRGVLKVSRIVLIHENDHRQTPLTRRQHSSASSAMGIRRSYLCGSKTVVLTMQLIKLLKLVRSRLNGLRRWRAAVPGSARPTVMAIGSWVGRPATQATSGLVLIARLVPVAS